MINNLIDNIKTKIREGKLIKYIVITFTIIFLLIVLIFILTNMNKSYSYYEVERQLKSAAIKYLVDNKNLLPTDENKVVIDASDLEESKYIKPINKLTKNTSCSAIVEVYYHDEQYKYIPFLDCQEKFQTKTLGTTIKENDPIVISGEGLYELNNELVYRGEKINNYIEFSDKLWRIVKIDKNSDIKLILADVLKDDRDRDIQRRVWDDRYNAVEEATYGINNYSVSRIKETLKEDLDYIVDEEDKDKLIQFESCIGKRMIEYNLNTGEAECGSLDAREYISLLPLHEYIYASLDNTCKKASDVQCLNYNYLAKFDSSWWTLTGVFENTYQIYMIDSRGEISPARAFDIAQIRPVITLNKHVIYNEGNGSLDNPYKIRNV